MRVPSAEELSGEVAGGRGRGAKLGAVAEEAVDGEGTGGGEDAGGEGVEAGAGAGVSWSAEDSKVANRRIESSNRKRERQKQER